LLDNSSDVLGEYTGLTLDNAKLVVKDSHGCYFSASSPALTLLPSPIVKLDVKEGTYNRNIPFVINDKNRTVEVTVCPGGSAKIMSYAEKTQTGADQYMYNWTKDGVVGTASSRLGYAGIKEAYVPSKLTGNYDDEGYFEVSTGDLVSANYGLTIKGSDNPNACSVDWKIYVNSSPSIASFESVERKCPNEKAEFVINGIKKVDKLELAYYRNEGGKLVEDKTLRENVPGFTSEGGKWYITNIANASNLKGADVVKYVATVTNEQDCTEEVPFIFSNLAAPVVTYTIKNGTEDVAKTVSTDPNDNVTLWTAEPVCPGTILTITLNNASADMTNYYVIKDAEGNSYGPTTSDRYNKSTPYTFRYTVPAVAAGGEVIRFTVNTDGMNGSVAQCAITEKLAIQVKPTVQFDMAASASQITPVSSASLVNNEKNTYCSGEKFYFYVRPYNENGELTNASVKVQNTALLAQPSTDKETIFNNGTLGYGMSGAQSDALGQYQTLKVSVTDGGCTSEGEYKVYVKPLPVVKTTKVYACPNSTFEGQLGDQGTANATVNEDNTIAKVDYAFQSTTNGTTTASQQSYDVTSLTQSFTAPVPVDGTTYSVGGVVTAKDGCTAEFTAEVALYPTPIFDAKAVKISGETVSELGDDEVICQGSPYAIKLKNNSTTAVVFKVKDNFGNQVGADINVASGGERQTTTFIAPNERTTVAYTISCITDNGCEGTESHVSVKVGVKPTLDFAPVAAVCSDPNGGQTPVTVTAAIGATNTANAGTIDFDNGVTGTFTASTLEIKNPLLSLQSYDENRTYSATYTDGNGCQSDPVTVTLSQVATPIISAQVEKDKVCPNDNNRVLLDDASSDFSKGYRYKLYAAEKDGNNKYQINGTAIKSWVIGNTITSGNRTYGVIDLPRQSASGVYMYAVESENTVNGKVCRDTAFFEYKVNQLPTIDLVVYKNSVAAANEINNGDAVCPETPLIFQVKNTSYNVMSTDWTLSSDKQNGNAPATSLNDASTDINWVSMDRAGTETVTILAVNDECSADIRFQYGVSTPAALRITSSETKLPADGTTLFCEGDTRKKTLTASGTSSTFSDFVWKKEGDVTTLSTENTLEISADDDIVYIVTAKDANGCEASAREIVKTVALPAITLNADPKIICSGEAVTLTSQKLPASYNIYGDNYSFKVRFDKDGDVATTADQTAFDLPISTLSDKATANVSSSNMTASTAYAYPQVTIDNGDVCVGGMASTTVKVIPSPSIVSVVKVRGAEANKKTNSETYMLCSSDAYTVEVNVKSDMFSGVNPSYTSATDFEISVDGVTKTVKGQNVAKFDMSATTGALTHSISITPIIDGNKRGACMAQGTISVDVYANPTIKLYTSNAQHTTNVDATASDGLAGAYLCASAGSPIGSVWINSFMTVDESTTMKSIEWAADNYSVPANNTQTSVEISRAVSGLKARITDNNGCVSDWSSSLAVELCEIAAPRVSVAKGCEGEAVSVILGDANSDVTTNNTLMNSMYTHYFLSYDNKTVERYLADDITDKDAQGRPYYSIPVAGVTTGTVFTASAYNSCGTTADYLSAECKSDPNTATATYNVSVTPQLKVTFQSLDNKEIDKVCPNTSFNVYVEVENFTSTANLTDSEKVLDLELSYVDNGQTKVQRGSISFNTNDENTKKTFF
ncbi:MAG: hypothetical protein UH071_02950, partial [Paludibacteraceae bacterium]|nr:hypothetical protein [Paludibacteraceae bacterium]